MGIEALQLGDNHLGIFILVSLSLVPVLLMMGTSFIKITVVLHILRTAIGAPAVPVTVIFGLTLVLTAFTMAPTAQKIYSEVTPSLAEIGPNQSKIQNYIKAGQKASPVIKNFLRRHIREDDLLLFVELSGRLSGDSQKSLSPDSLLVLLPAFAVGELTEAFAIGFILFLPFLVIELVVANTLLALGMHMLSPGTISLPFKLLLFVMVDGWMLVTRGLLLSYT